MASCPYCNAPLTGSSLLVCPRCGERVPERILQAAQAEHLTDTPPLAPPPVPTAPPIRRTAAVVVALMSVMALTGLGFALWTIPDRRAHDTRRINPVLPPQPVVVPADELVGLGYLPPDTNFVAGLDLTAARHEPLGEQVLSSLTGTAGQPPVVDLARYTGLDAAEIDHVILGVRLNDDAPRVVLVVHTRRPYSLSRVCERLQAQPEVTAGSKKIHLFTLGKQLPGTQALWSPNETTLVIGLNRKYLDVVPDHPAAQAGALAAPVRQILHDRVGTGAFVWVLGNLPEGQSPEVLIGLFAYIAKLSLTAEDTKGLAGVKSFGLWLRSQEGLQLRGLLDTRNAATAQLAEDKGAALQAQVGPLLKYFQATPGLERLAQSFLDSFKHDRHDTVLSFEAHADADTVRQSIRPKTGP